MTGTLLQGHSGEEFCGMAQGEIWVDFFEARLE